MFFPLLKSKQKNQREETKNQVTTKNQVARKGKKITLIS